MRNLRAHRLPLRRNWRPERRRRWRAPATPPLPLGRLDGRRAFVSGGAQGIGAAIVRSFAAAGAKVVIAELDAAGASAVAGATGATAVRLDVSDTEKVREAMAAH